MDKLDYDIAKQNVEMSLFYGIIDGGDAKRRLAGIEAMRAKTVIDEAREEKLGEDKDV